jgi:hypothetical protein
MKVVEVTIKKLLLTKQDVESLPVECLRATVLRATRETDGIKKVKVLDLIKVLNDRLSEEAEKIARDILFDGLRSVMSADELSELADSDYYLGFEDDASYEAARSPILAVCKVLLDEAREKALAARRTP